MPDRLSLSVRFGSEVVGLEWLSLEVGGGRWEEGGGRREEGEREEGGGRREEGEREEGEREEGEREGEREDRRRREKKGKHKHIYNHTRDCSIVMVHAPSREYNFEQFVSSL